MKGRPVGRAREEASYSEREHTQTSLEQRSGKTHITGIKPMRTVTEPFACLARRGAEGKGRCAVVTPRLRRFSQHCHSSEPHLPEKILILVIT